MNKKYGYARCSLAEEKGQDLNRQVRELKAAGAEEIITEREHGDAKVKENLEMLLELARKDGISLGGKLTDCGTLVFDNTKQDVHAGGSGCGCSAITLCGDLLDKLNNRKLKKILFCGTGALLSPTSTQQGLPIPGVCHAVCITGGN